MKKIITIFFILFIVNIGFAQTPTNSVSNELEAIEYLLDNDQLSKAEEKLKVIQEQRLSSLNTNTLESQIYFRTLALYHLNWSEMKAANKAILKAIDKIGVEPDSINQIIKTYERAVSIFKTINRADEGIKIAQQLQQIYANSDETYRLDQAANYREIGLFYLDKGEANKSLEYFDKAFAIYQKHPQTKPIQIASIYGARSIAYASLKKFDEQLSSINQAMKYSKRDTSQRSQLIQISLLSYLANYYIYTSQYPKALETYQQYLDKIIMVRGRYHPSTATGYMNTAIAYAQTGNLETSEKYFEESLEITTKLYGKHNASLALNYSNFTLLLHMMKKYPKALRAAHQAFTANVINYTDTNHLADLTPFIAKHEILDPVNLIGNLNNRGKIFYDLYLETNDIKYLKSAYSNLMTQIAIFDKTKNTLSDKDKLKVLGEQFMPYANGIDYAYQLYIITKNSTYLDLSFELAERSKDAVLSSSLNAKKALNIGGIPDTLIAKENTLKKQIAKLEKKRYNTKQDSESYIAIQSRLFDLKRNLERFVQKLEKEYPAYLAYKNNPTTASIQAIQDYLQDDRTAVLAYYVGKDNLFIWKIMSDSKSFHRVPLDSNHLEKVATYRNILTNVNYFRNNSNRALNEYRLLGFDYYEDLIATALDSDQVKNLIIIPDNFLGHLPFETFLTKKLEQVEIEFDKFPYLVQDYNIQYSYSGNLLLQNRAASRQLESNNQVLGVAALYRPDNILNNNLTTDEVVVRKHLIPLPEATKEVQALERLLEGKFLYGAKANEKNFKQNIGNYGILHLAMHGILNAEATANSALAFSEKEGNDEDDFLYASEIVNLPLQTQLVVLSACETGYGKFTKGEGVMSLARSFMHAGVPSLVVSMWQVNDYSTAKVMEFFYQELKQGKNKSEALRLAKLSYIERAEGIAAHPAFWAAFIQLGDNSTLDLQTFHWTSIILVLSIISVLLFIGIFIYRKRAK